MTGLSNGTVYFTMYATYALSFWYGTKLVLNNEIEVGDVMTTFFGVIIAAFALGGVSCTFKGIGGLPWFVQACLILYVSF